MKLRKRKKARDKKKRKKSGLEELSIKVKWWSYDVSKLSVWEDYRVGLSRVVIGECDGEPKYVVLDPPLTREELAYLSAVARKLVFILPREALESREEFYSALREAGISDEKLLYYLDREVRGFSSLDPLMRDPNLENIECSLAGTPVLVVHKKYGRMETNLVYTREELDELVVRLAHMAGRSVSTFKPKIDSAVLPGGHRLALTYRSEVSPTSSFTIRKFPEKPWTIAKMLVNKMLTPEAAAWLWLLIENHLAVIVFGAMGTGKTSLVNSLMNLIPPDAMVGTVEDVAEFKIAHKYWVRLVAREAETIGGVGEITLASLLAHALRRNLDYIVVNEVRFEEARIWAQAIALGHGGLCLPHDQLVPMIVDGRAGIYRIGEVVEKALRGEVREIRVLSWDGEKAIWAPVSKVVRKSGSRRFFRIRLEGGIEFEVHEGHPVLVYRNGSLVRKRASEVRKGDFVPVLKQIPALEPRMEHLDVIEVLGGRYGDELYVEGVGELLEKVGYGRLRELLPDVNYFTMWDWRRSRTAMPLRYYLKVKSSKSYRSKVRVKYGEKGRHSIPALLRLNRDMGYVIGLFLADGSLRYDEKDDLPCKVVFYVRTDKVPRVVERLKAIGLPEGAIGVGETKSAKARTVVVYSKVFALLLYHLLDGKVRDYDRAIPLDIALRAPKEFREGLLEGYWDGDGSLIRVGKNALRAMASTVNEELGHSVALTAKTLGVHVLIKVVSNERGFGSKGSKAYVLQVAGSDSLKRFLEAIGWRGEVSVSARGRLRDAGGLLLCRVISVEEVEKDSDLYDFEVPVYHNFAMGGNCVLTSNTTIHAESPELVFARLRDLGVTPSLLSALHGMVWTWLYRARRGGRVVRLRRVKAVYDIEFEGGEVVLKKLFDYSLEEDSLKCSEDEVLTCRSARIVMEANGWSEEDLLYEWQRRSDYLKKLRDVAERNPSVAELDTLSAILRDFYRRTPVKYRARRARREERLAVEHAGVRFCPNCGRELVVPNPVFCPFCGKRLALGVVSAEEAGGQLS